MSYEETRGYVIRCDDCSVAYGEDYEGAILFRTRQEAVVAFTDSDWFEVGDKLVCPSCIASRICLAEGHRWSEWKDVVNERYIGRRRCCKRCPAEEADPPVRSSS